MRRLSAVLITMFVAACSSGPAATPIVIYVTPGPTAATVPTAAPVTLPPSTPTAPPSPTDTPTPTISLAAKDARASIFVIGNASPSLPAGDPGVVALIARAAKLDSSGSLAIVVRNNTSEAVERITASATIEDASGTLIATGSDQGLNPNHVEPGEIAFGYIYFSGVQKLPTGAKVDIELDSTPAAENPFENILDLKGLRASRVKGSYSYNIVGQLINQYTDPVSGPIGVRVACFDTSGHILHTDTGFTNEDSLSPNGKASYTVGLSGSCPVFLVAGAGFSL